MTNIDNWRVFANITNTHFLHTYIQTFQEKIIFGHEQLQAFISLPDSRPTDCLRRQRERNRGNVNAAFRTARHRAGFHP